MLDGQGYLKEDESIGYYRVKTERNLQRNKIKKSKLTDRDNIQIYILLDRIKILDDDKNIKFDSGNYFKKYVFKSDKIDKFPIFYKKMLRILSIHNICFGEVLPFVFHGKWIDQSVWYPPYVTINSVFMEGINDRWKDMLNDVVILNKAIPLESILEKALIWYTLGQVSTTNMEGFMCYYRTIETFANNFSNRYKSDLNKYLKNTFYMFKEFNKKSIFSQLDKSVVPSYLRMNNCDEGLIIRMKNFRDKIAHGHKIELEFNNNLLKTKIKMKELSYDLIFKKIKNMKIKNLKKHDFQRDYYLYIHDESDEINVYEDNDIEHEKLKTPYILKQFGAWTDDDINKILKLKKLDSATKKDIKYYLRLKKQGKYKDSASVTWRKK